MTIIPGRFVLVRLFLVSLEQSDDVQVVLGQLYNRLFNYICSWIMLQFMVG